MEKSRATSEEKDRATSNILLLSLLPFPFMVAGYIISHLKDIKTYLPFLAMWFVPADDLAKSSWVSKIFIFMDNPSSITILVTALAIFSYMLISALFVCKPSEKPPDNVGDATPSKYLAFATNQVLSIIRALFQLTTDDCRPSVWAWLSGLILSFGHVVVRLIFLNNVATVGNVCWLVLSLFHLVLQLSFGLVAIRKREPVVNEKRERERKKREEEKRADLIKEVYNELESLAGSMTTNE